MAKDFLDEIIPKKTFIILSGFLIRPTHKNGCEVGYVTHTNPRGKIPPWLTNKISSSVAPKMLQRLHKACLAYPDWKSKHRPNFKYWLNPEQMTSPRITLSDVSFIVRSAAQYSAQY